MAAAAIFPGSREAREVFFRDDTGWVLLSKTELEAPLFQRDTVAGVFVYASAEEGIRVVRERSREAGEQEVSRRSFVRFDPARSFPSLAKTDPIEADLSRDDTALIASFIADIDTFVPDVSIPSFIPPVGTAMIPVTAPIDGVDTSLLGQALASFGARPQSVAVITVPPSNITALLWPEQQTFSPGFAEEQAQKLAGTLADRFPKVVVKTLPDGSTAELLTRDPGQFQPTVLDVGETAAQRARTPVNRKTSQRRHRHPGRSRPPRVMRLDA